MNRLTAVLMLLVSACLPALAALPPLSPEQKAATAAVIATGKVDSAAIEIGGTATHSIYEITLTATVDKVEKGEDLVNPSQTVTIHCWRLRTAQPGWAGPSGHHSIPAEGATFRVWMNKNDSGEWEPLAPNGFELIGDSEALSFTAAEKSMHKGFLALTVVGAMLILGIFLYASRGRRS